MPPRLVLANQNDEALAGSYEAWAGGYLDGMEMSEDEWFGVRRVRRGGRVPGHPPVADRHTQRTAADEAAEVGDPWPPEGTTEEELVADAREALAESVLALYRFWQAKGPPATVRRNGGKVGRNEPCPCSGKKFKQCCGKDAT